MPRLPVLAAAVATAAAALAAAASPAAADRRTHLAFGAGGVSAQPDFRLGLWGGVEVAAPGRWGGRADVYVVEAGERRRLLLEAGAQYQLASSRPHFMIHGFFGAGVATPDPAAVLHAGLTTQLKIAGPLALGLVTALHFELRAEPIVTLTTALGLKLSF